ncbi:hypothetical protein OPQ81_003584 [Rhizoctonia solani]|nr:hypothetical protein OPQ81_003584 [Rhizoctonia solani]
MSTYSTNAAGVNKYTAERHQRILQELLQQPGNDVCADCKSRAPRWSSWNLGIFICVQCASIHRKIGTHITKVKSVNLDAWTKEQVESVKNIGNIASNAKWNPNESRNPPPTNLEESERDSEMEKYIRAKYETKKFIDRKPVTSSSPSSSTPIAAQPSTSTPIPRQPKPKVEDSDPTQTVPLGFGRESRVEFNIPGMGGVGGDIWDGIIQQKKVPPRSKTAPIPEPVTKATPPPAPAIPAPVPVSNLPSRSVSAQPPAAQLGVNTAVPTNGVWGDMLALQSVGGSLPTSAIQAPPLQTTNPYASLSASPSTSLPSALANRMGQTRSFTAPAPNPFFNPGHQQQPSTGSANSLLSVPTGNSFGSAGLGPVPTGGSFVSTGSLASGTGTSPGGLNPFGASPTVGNAFGTSPGGSFGTSTSIGGSFGVPSGGSFGTPTSAFGTSVMSPGQMTTQSLPFQQTTQPSPFQQTTMSPFGAGAGNSLPSLNTNATSLSAFGAAMSPPGQTSHSPFAQPSNSPFAQPSNSPFAQPSNSPFAQASNSPFAQPSNTPFGQAGTPFSGSTNLPFQTPNPGFQSTPTNNALFLQPNNTTHFQPSTSPFQTTNPSFPQPNAQFQAAGTNPFASMGAGGGMNTNPFGQPQYQGQQGWGGM